MSPRNCLLCGADGLVRIAGDRGFFDADQAELVWAMVEWIQPVEGVRWTSLPRCLDRAGCRARVAASGEPWPVRDAGSRVDTERLEPPGWVATAGEEPMQPVATPQGHAEEASPADDLLAVLG